MDKDSKPIIIYPSKLKALLIIASVSLSSCCIWLMLNAWMEKGESLSTIIAIGCLSAVLLLFPLILGLLNIFSEHMGIPTVKIYHDRMEYLQYIGLKYKTYHFKKLHSFKLRRNHEFIKFIMAHFTSGTTEDTGINDVLFNHVGKINMQLNERLQQFKSHMDNILKENIECWLSQFVTEEIPESINALYFGLSESDNGQYLIFLTGAEVYDPEDDDCACDIIWEPTDNYLLVSDELIYGMNWKTFENKVTEILYNAFCPETSEFSKWACDCAIVTGFDDGDLHRII